MPLAFCHGSFSDAVARVHASDASRFSRAQIGTPVCFGRARSFGERLTVCIGPGEAAKVGAIAFAHAGDEDDMVACCACAGADKLSPVNATAAKT
jgi:hypothetical protein